jgi:predicted transcriptional regulator
MIDAKDYRKCRKSQGLTQKEAADLLDLSLFMISNYKKGLRGEDGSPVTILRYFRMAIGAITSGIINYDGPAD